MASSSKSSSVDVKPLKKKISEIIDLATKYQSDETKKCWDVFETATKAAADSSGIYTNYFTKTLDKINSLTRQAKKAQETQMAEMNKDYQLKVTDNEFLPALTDCIGNLETILKDLYEITKKTGEIANFISPLMGKHTNLMKKIYRYRNYWLDTKIKKKYDSIINRSKLMLEVNIPNNIKSETLEKFINDKPKEIDNFEKRITAKHNKHQTLMDELKDAYRRGWTYACGEMRREMVIKKTSETDDISMSEAENMSKNPELQKRKAKQLTLLQRNVQAQLNEFKKLSPSKISKPECLKSSPDLRLKGVKKQVLIGKPLFYMMGVLNGLKFVVGMLQKQILPMLDGYEKKIFENEHRRRALARRITKKTVSVTIQVVSLVSGLTGLGGQICEALSAIYETALSLAWLIHGAMYSVSEFVSPAMDKDSDELEKELNNLETNFKELSEVSDSSAFDKYFDEWETTNKISLSNKNEDDIKNS